MDRIIVQKKKDQIRVDHFQQRICLNNYKHDKGNDEDLFDNSENCLRLFQTYSILTVFDNILSSYLNLLL